MSKKKACKKCRIFVEGDECPVCKGASFVLNWKGRVFISEPSKSRIAQRMKVSQAGEYAIKVS
jgi:DNA-directed RNA polymerase subunit E"